MENLSDYAEIAEKWIYANPDFFLDSELIADLVDEPRKKEEEGLSSPQKGLMVFKVGLDAERSACI